VRAPAPRAAPLTPMRVLVADDHAVVRSSFRRLLDAQAGIEVVGEAANGREAVDASRHQPDVVLMDIMMPALDGIEATRQLRAPPARPGRHSDHLQPRRVRVRRAEGRRVRLPLEALVRGRGGRRRAGGRGQRRAPAAVGDQAPGGGVRQATASALAEGAELSLLTTREREVLDLVARRFSNADIASRISVSEGTVKTHVSHVLDRLDLCDRVHAVIVAYETGLVGP
jgi:DNA-binding NarL/FixJ family response regulator